MEYIYFEEIDSTNDYAKNIKDKKDWTVIYADLQSGGRGRNGKKWISSKGGAWFTIIFCDNGVKIEDYGKIPLVIGAVIRKYLSQITGKNFTIKWPNDIYYEDKKCCGILVEKIGKYFIAGIGINVNNQLGESGTEYGIALKDICFKEFTILEIIKDITKNLNNYIEKLKNGFWNEIYAEISENDYLNGKEVIVTDGISKKNVVVLGILYEGMLKVRNENGMIEEILSGDISVKIEK